MSVLDEIRRDARACLERDPAARNLLEVLLAYPGFHARQFHRLSHALWRRNIPVLPRFVSHVSRFLTGIEIHPGAVLGSGVFIDHGLGVVIGETAEVGDDCTIYQGVTLGGVSTLRTKRHPTLGSRVVVGAGAHLMGSISIGDDTKVGAGSVVVQSVPAGATVVGVPGRVVAIRHPQDGTIERLPDPLLESLQALQKRLHSLEERLAELEGKSVPNPDERAFSLLLEQARAAQKLEDAS